jgi:uncharacterized protein YjbJ (UPF0337 family)
MHPTKEQRMSGTTDNIKGNVKETAGAVTGDEQLEAEGKTDQLTGRLKDAVSDVKDAAEGAIDKVRDAAKRD